MSGSPQRTCIGCRQVVDKGDLVRLVVDGNRIRVDHDGNLPGRGAHVHPVPQCIEAAARGGLNRSFRRGFSAGVVSAFREAGAALGALPKAHVEERASHEHGEDAGL